jgi:DUF1680 family protein
LGSFDLEGRNFYYQNPLDSGGPRYPWHNCPCCVGNIPRTLFMLPTWIYAKGDGGVYVNLFIGSETTIDDVVGTKVELIQETNYPWDGDVVITVNPAQSKRFAVHVRTPNRDVSELYEGAPEADGLIRLSVNGDEVEPNVERGYAVIDREWQAGDKIELELPMRVQRVRASDQIEATRGRVALRYGPLMYSIESVDQPVDGALDREAELTTEWRPDLLEGVLVIHGKFADGSAMMAIPNYARNNRIPLVRLRPPLEGESDEQPVEGRGWRRREGGRSLVWMQEEAK